MEQSYVRLATAQLGGLGNSCTLEAALDWFERLEGEWLLVFDGADDVAAISSLWPPPGSHGNIIYTSRNHMLQRLPEDQTCKVDQMDPGEASRLLLSSARITFTNAHYANAESIAKLLGYLALAVDQAGAYILSGICSLEKFAETFENKSASLLSNDAYNGATSYDRAVYASWELSYNAICHMAASTDHNNYQKEGAKLATQLLNIFGFWHHDNITYEIFRYASENPLGRRQYGYEADDDPEGKFDRGKNLPLNLLERGENKKWDDSKFRKGVAVLVQFSLVDKDHMHERLSMHSLVHAWARSRQKGAQYRQSLLEARALLAASCDRRNAVESENHSRSLLPHYRAIQTYHTTDVDDLNVPEKDAFAWSLHLNRRFAEEQKLLEAVLAEMQPMLDSHWLMINRCAAALALCYANQSRDIDAARLKESVLGFSTQFRRCQHGATLYDLARLGSWYGCVGLRRGSLGFHLRSTILTASGYPLDNKLDSIYELANECSSSHHFAGLLQGFQHTYKVMAGETHPYGVYGTTTLALCYLVQERYIEAEQTIMPTAEAVAHAHGSTHPDALLCCHVQAVIENCQGRFEDATNLLQATIRSCEDVLGISHDDTIQAKIWLGRSYLYQRRFDEAIEALLTVIKLSEEHRGMDDPCIPQCKMLLAAACYSKGQLLLAEEALSSALLFYERCEEDDQRPLVMQRCRTFLPEIHSAQRKQVQGPDDAIALPLR